MNFIPSERLVDWLTYADIGPTLDRFIGNTYILTDLFSSRQCGEPTSPIWEKDEWSMGSVLVPIERLEEAQRTLTSYDLKITPGWVDRDNFDFATSAQRQGIPVRPWSYLRKHPANGAYLADVQRDFMTYHALDQRGNGDKFELVHPIDGIDVIRVRIETIAYYSPTLRLEVHRDYLRDFLAAARLGMVVVAVGDRFRHERTAENMIAAESRSPDDVEVTLQEESEGKEKYWRARSVLHRTTVIEPYATPKPERSPWYCNDLPSRPSSAIQFILDAEGNTGTLDRSPAYLFFRPGVLRKYLKNPNDSIGFHMRSWGGARPVGAAHSIDVGINSAGLVNAFAPDLAKQNISEQQYWASFACLPSGPVCEELFLTRMQQAPPKSPGSIDLINREIGRLNSAYQSRFGEIVHHGALPDEKVRQQLSVGPLEEDWAEVTELAKHLCSWVVEGLSISALRKALAQIPFEVAWRQIKLTEVLMSQVLGCEQPEVVSVVAPLKDLNWLRVHDAHSLDDTAVTHFKFSGLRVRGAWFLILDGVAGALRVLSDRLGHKLDQKQP